MTKTIKTTANHQKILNIAWKFSKSPEDFIIKAKQNGCSFRMHLLRLSWSSDPIIHKSRTRVRKSKRHCPLRMSAVSEIKSCESGYREQPTLGRCNFGDNPRQCCPLAQEAGRCSSSFYFLERRNGLLVHRDVAVTVVRPIDRWFPAGEFFVKAAASKNSASKKAFSKSLYFDIGLDGLNFSGANLCNKHVNCINK